MIKKTKLKTSMWISLFLGVTFAYFMWLVWSKLTSWVGNSDWVLIITGGIILIAIIFGKFGIDKVIKKFS